VLKECAVLPNSYVSANRTMTKCRILHCCKNTNTISDSAGFEQRRYREREVNPAYEPAAMGQALIKVFVVCLSKNCSKKESNTKFFYHALHENEKLTNKTLRLRSNVLATFEKKV
jgi:hypothetical protein